MKYMIKEIIMGFCLLGLILVCLALGLKFGFIIFIMCVGFSSLMIAFFLVVANDVGAFDE